ncbi:MAG: carbohydrate kinase family protein, partial [Acidobacteriota bacterium]|nr:carbohydrate kinase family protein [Acidobacteriota bacterium]
PLACARVAREARAAGTIVSADIDNIYEGLPELLPLIDVLISSKEFPHRLTGITDERAALAEVKARMGTNTLVGMTRGERGALIFHEGKLIETPAFPVPGGCRDTTGAGDAFHAGFLYGMLQGEEIETCLTLGCAVAALKCRRLGARAGLPTPAELTALLSP